MKKTITYKRKSYDERYKTRATDDFVKGLISSLVRRVRRGDYTDGIPKANIKGLGRRNPYWTMLNTAQKQVYLKLMEYIVRDSQNADHHIGDEHFQSLVIGGVDKHINLVYDLCTETYTNDETLDFPNKLKQNIHVSSSNFNYGELMKTLNTYTNNPMMRDETRNRRYDERGDPILMPLDPEAQNRFKGMFDQWEIGRLRLIALDPSDQEDSIIANMPKQTNTGFPFFTKGTDKNLRRILFDLMEIVDFKYKVSKDGPEWCKKENRPYVTARAITELFYFMDNQKLYLPFMLFYRTQRVKHRVVCGAPLDGKYIAGFVKSCFELGYENAHPDSFLDDKASKQLFGFGGLPIVAKLEWNEMFDMIRDRLPPKDCVMHIDEVKRLFNYVVPKEHQIVGKPNYTYVNVICGDFSGFDTGQIYEEYKWLETHSTWGKFFKVILNQLNNAEVWSGMNAFSGIFFKSGFFGTSDFGSAFHHASTCYAVKKIGAAPIAHVCLSDDDILFVCANRIVHAQEIIDVYAEYGHTIKLSASHDWSKNPIVSFLKVHVGYIFSDDDIAIIGDPQSRYYNLAHSERDVEKEIDHMDAIGYLKDTWMITRDPEVNRHLSKMSSGGEQYNPFNRLHLEQVNGSDLGDRSILAISTMDPDAVYKQYRDDLMTAFSPNSLAKISVDDLITNKSGVRTR